MRRRRTLVLVAAFSCLIPGSPASADQGLYLSHIKTATDQSLPDPSGAALVVEVEFADVSKAASLIASATTLDVKPIDTAALRLTAPAAGTLRGRPESRDLANSFVIDHAEVAIAQLVERLRKTEEIGDAAKLIDTLTRFVHDEIPDKTARHGFLIASQVAANGAGDCTEHAVLLVALARALGMPARVAIGVLLVDDGTTMGVYGHAWAEIHDGTTWRIADATHPETLVEGGWFRHVPLTGLQDEGPGFGMSVLNGVVVLPAAIRSVSPAQSPSQR